jgi:hypothetical protein
MDGSYVQFVQEEGSRSESLQSVGRGPVVRCPLGHGLFDGNLASLIGGLALAWLIAMGGVASTRYSTGHYHAAAIGPKGHLIPAGFS